MLESIKPSLDEKYIRMMEAMTKLEKRRNEGLFKQKAIPFTPLPLLEDMLSKVNPKLEDNILILFTVEAVPLLQYYGFSNITVATDTYCPFTAKACGIFGVKYTLIEEAQKMKFDAVIMNSPYQNNNNSGNFALWPEFIKKATEIADTVAVVCPQTWASNTLNPNKRSQFTAKLRAECLSKGYLSYVDFSIGNHFNVGSTFSYFVWHSSGKGLTTVTDIDKNEYTIDYSNAKYLPLRKVEELVLPKNLKPINGLRETTGFRNSDDDGEYLIANTSAQYSKGIFVKSKKPHPYQNVRKVIWSDSGYAKPFYDDGKLGLGHHARAFEVADEKEAQEVIDFIESERVMEVSKTIADTGAASAFAKVCSVYEI